MHVLTEVERCVLLNSVPVGDDHRRHGSVGFDRPHALRSDDETDAVAADGILLTYMPEKVWGKYLRR